MTACARRYPFTGEEVIRHLEAASTPNDVVAELKRLAKLDGDKLVHLVALALAIPIMICEAGAFSVHGALAAKGQGI
jgi:hypothetical protein